MDKVTTTESSANVAARVTDDIPIAQRETPVTAVKPTVNKSYLIGGLAAVGVMAAGAGAFAAFQIQ